MEIDEDWQTGRRYMRMEENDTHETDEFMDKIEAVKLTEELVAHCTSTVQCMEILSIAMHKGIDIYAVKGNWQLDHSIQSKIIAMAFSMASEIVRKKIKREVFNSIGRKKEEKR